jgi:hypothetical protein
MKTSSKLLAHWIYQALLWLYPPQFRREFGAQMRQDFALIYQSSRQGRSWWRGIAFWALVGKDIAGSLWREYRALLPAPRGWWWLRLVAVVSVSVGVYSLLDVLRWITRSQVYPEWFIMAWWSMYIPIKTVGVTLPLWFGLWTLPARGQTQRIVRGASLLSGTAILVPHAIWFIERGPMFMLNSLAVEPLLGAWEPLIVNTLLPAIAMLSILFLSGISLRWPSHRWWSIAMLLIYLAPALTRRIVVANGYTPDILSMDETAFWNAMGVLDTLDMLSAFGWIFLGVKLWMSVPWRAKQLPVPAAG